MTDQEFGLEHDRKPEVQEKPEVNRETAIKNGDKKIEF